MASTRLRLLTSEEVVFPQLVVLKKQNFHQRSHSKICQLKITLTSNRHWDSVSATGSHYGHLAVYTQHFVNVNMQIYDINYCTFCVEGATDQAQYRLLYKHICVVPVT